MSEPEQYRLLDFGRGQKLEQFGQTIVCRQTPSVHPQEPKSSGVQWNSDLSYRQGQWIGTPPDNWIIEHNQKRFLLKPAPSGQVGIFPEQVANWEWIESLPGNLDGLRALNLFAYTGGTTLALATRGVEVVHVDASKSVVNWARQNAALSQMESLPIRWIVEDAAKYVRREIKRNSKFEILVADPPSFGRGPSGQHWKFERDIEELVHQLSLIAAENLQAVLLTAHTPGFGPKELQKIVTQNFSFSDPGTQSRVELEIRSDSGKRYSGGSCFRYHRQ